jgi:hypothetical protein
MPNFLKSSYFYYFLLYFSSYFFTFSYINFFILYFYLFIFFGACVRAQSQGVQKLDFLHCK